MNRVTYFENGKWRIRIGNTEYAADWVDRLAAYENTGLEPDELIALLKHINTATQNCVFNETAVEQQAAILNSPWNTALELSTRPYNCLKHFSLRNPDYRLETVADVACMDKAQIENIFRAGTKTYKEIAAKLRVLGITASDWYLFG